MGCEARFDQNLNLYECFQHQTSPRHLLYFQDTQETPFLCFLLLILLLQLKYLNLLIFHQSNLGLDEPV